MKFMTEFSVRLFILVIVKDQFVSTSNYFCSESNRRIAFAQVSSTAHSASDSAQNCLLQQCDVTSSQESICSARRAACFNYQVANGSSMCAPGIACSILEPCNNITLGCAPDSVCVVNTCCTPQRVCVPVISATFCSLANSTRYNATLASLTSMFETRMAHTATIISHNLLLVAGGQRIISDSVNSAEIFDLSSSTWISVMNMSEYRAYHTASVLFDANVLVVGGTGRNDSSINTVEIFDTISRTWRTTSPMNIARSSHTATVLLDGKVLVTGGLNSFGIENTAEIFDPTSETWTLTYNNMNDRRYYHTASLLSNGSIMVAGGRDGGINSLNSVDIYDPVNDMWNAAFPMWTARYLHRAINLHDGRVLITGGANANNLLAVAEIFNSSSNNFERISNFSYPRMAHTAGVLNDGNVLIIGGLDLFDTPIPYFEILQISSLSWLSISIPYYSGGFHTMSVFPRGSVVIVGGMANRNITRSAYYFT